MSQNIQAKQALLVHTSPSQPSAKSRKAYPLLDLQRPLRDWFFERVHGSKLVYNTCWEDPRADRRILQFQADSEVVMITSAGCNALSYLLDQPSKIHCIDVNPRQNALLDLKVAAIKTLDWPTLFALFGEGSTPEAKTIYQQLRPLLSPYAVAYWDQKIHYFLPKKKRNSFYYRGSSGYFAWFAKQYLAQKKKLFPGIQTLLEAKDMPTQIAAYYAIEDRLLKALVGGKLRQNVSLSLVGVPDAQRQLIQANNEGLRAYVQKSFRHIFTQLPIHDNYFYRVYLEGRYQADCCPDYLQADQLDLLKEQVGKLQLHTTTIADFLRENPSQYSHFVLLDHQDWLAANAPAALAEEWELILANSRPGTKILIRSASPKPDVVPVFVREKVKFHTDLSDLSQQMDRVGTYAGTFLLEVC